MFSQDYFVAGSKFREARYQETQKLTAFILTYILKITYILDSEFYTNVPFILICF